jgi:hypothetical protein
VVENGGRRQPRSTTRGTLPNGAARLERKRVSMTGIRPENAEKAASRGDAHRLRRFALSP